MSIAASGSFGSSSMAIAAGLQLRAKLTSDLSRDELWRSAPARKAYVKIFPKLKKARSCNSIILCRTCTWSKKCHYDVNEPQLGVGRLDKKHAPARYHPSKALPSEAVGAAVAIAVIGASLVGLQRLNSDTSSASSAPKKVQCEACDGSGLCSSCNGEGFQLKALSQEAAAKARANAKDAATRYTAGLAKKWNYCASCSGSRKCMACDGRGSLSASESNI